MNRRSPELVGTFKERVMLARAEKGWTQVELSNAIGFSASNGSLISHYENGNRLPSAESLVKLAVELEVSVDWLLGLTDRPQPWRH